MNRTWTAIDNNRPKSADFGQAVCHGFSSRGPSIPLPGTVHSKTISPLNDETTAVQHKSIWYLASVQATGGTVDVPKATVKIVSEDGEEKIAHSNGTGLVDAAYKALNQIIKIPVAVREYTTSVTGGGMDAIATTRVVVDVAANASKNAAIHALTGKSFSGSGESRDIAVSSVAAYLNALNKICSLIASNIVRADDELQALREENARIKEELTRLKEDKEREIARLMEDKEREVAHLKEDKEREIACLMEDKEREVAHLKEDKDLEIARLMEDKECEIARLMEDKEREVAHIKDKLGALASYEDMCQANAHLQSKLMSAPECVRGPRAPAGNV